MWGESLRIFRIREVFIIVADLKYRLGKGRFALGFAVRGIRIILCQDKGYRSRYCRFLRGEGCGLLYPDFDGIDGFIFDISFGGSDLLRVVRARIQFAGVRLSVLIGSQISDWISGSYFSSCLRFGLRLIQMIDSTFKRITAIIIGDRKVF